MFYRTHVFDPKGNQIAVMVNPTPEVDNQEGFDAFIKQYESRNYIVVDLTDVGADVWGWKEPDSGVDGCWASLQEAEQPDWLKAWILINQ